MNADANGITVWPIPPESAGALRFDLHGMIKPSAAQASAIDQLWDDLRKEHPRLFDGPVLLVDREAMGRDRLICFRGSYKHLAVSTYSAAVKRPDPPPQPFCSLGVQGIVVGRDADGDEVVLMGRRSSETRVYGGLWENAPSGTMPPPPSDQDYVDWGDFITALRAEGIEELGLNLDASSVQWLALLDDAHASSIDVVLRLDIMQTVDPKLLPCPIHEGRWEYVDSAWVPTARLREWAAKGAAVSPPTMALFRVIGWV